MKFKSNLIPFVLLLITVSMTSCKKKGCTNPNAPNYDSSAEKDDGSCEIEQTGVYIYSVVATPTASEKVTVKNNSGSDVDLSGWTIGDLNDPNAYSIPNSTIVSQGNTLTKNASTMGFQINDSGETIYLKNSQGSTVDTWSN